MGRGGAARMRKSLEMVTASRMQNVVQIRKKNIDCATEHLFVFVLNFTLGLSASRAPPPKRHKSIHKMLFKNVILCFGNVLAN